VALITDPLGGHHWKKSYKALRSTGRLGMFGISVATTSKLLGPLRLLPVAHRCTLGWQEQSLYADV
jgi:NADPH:quinone reductase-like Zn-dependent oxidoreductase